MRTLSLIISLFFALSMSAQSDFDIARKFMAEKGVTLVNSDKAATRGNAKPYSIFSGEDNKGFAIVVNGTIVGYSTENSADADNMPQALEDMLAYYSKSTTRTRGNYPDWFVPRDIAPIETLITAHWTQASPFNDSLIIKNGYCVTVAIGQILHYYRIKECQEVEIWGQDIKTIKERAKIGGLWPIDTTFDILHRFTLPYTTFNHDLMFDEVKDIISNFESRKEVAKFMKYVESCISNNVYYTDFQTALGITWERYTAHKEIYEREKDDKYEYINAWHGLIEDVYDFMDKYLEDRVPLYATCTGTGSSNHAFVVDGRDSDGRYHINWGFKGNLDGYYAVSNDDKRSELNSEAELIKTFIILKPKDWTSSINNKVHYSPTINENVYNLKGQKVGDSLEGLPKGVYIKGGKKYVVR